MMVVTKRLDRRQFVSLLGTGVAVGLAGCSASGSTTEPEYDSGDIPGEPDGEERTPEEMTTAEALAEQGAQDDLITVSGLSITNHEFVFEEGYTGSTVQGTVENTVGKRIETAEVRIRVYNDDGEQLGPYLDTTNDFDSGTEWSFEVILLEAPADIADYDIAVVGLPD